MSTVVFQQETCQTSSAWGFGLSFVTDESSAADWTWRRHFVLWVVVMSLVYYFRIPLNVCTSPRGLTFAFLSQNFSSLQHLQNPEIFPPRRAGSSHTMVEKAHLILMPMCCFQLSLCKKKNRKKALANIIFCFIYVVFFFQPLKSLGFLSISQFQRHINSEDDSSLPASEHQMSPELTRR